MAPIMLSILDFLCINLFVETQCQDRGRRHQESLYGVEKRESGVKYEVQSLQLESRLLWLDLVSPFVS